MAEAILATRCCSLDGARGFSRSGSLQPASPRRRNCRAMPLPCELAWPTSCSGTAGAALRHGAAMRGGARPVGRAAAARPAQSDRRPFHARHCLGRATGADGRDRLAPALIAFSREAVALGGGAGGRRDRAGLELAPRARPDHGGAVGHGVVAARRRTERDRGSRHAAITCCRCSSGAPARCNQQSWDAALAIGPRLLLGGLAACAAAAPARPCSGWTTPARAASACRCRACASGARASRSGWRRPSRPRSA